ncbi:MAG: PrsW family intramembrane metalloprotease [Candidatus Pacebacteria bacterium]|nr:PrsW family intramembrane metalloprotease [Candidatus Paceibacterota bacterium]
MILSPLSIGFAILGGILPTLLWLWFWLREDRKRPEPNRLLLISFVLGMCAVPLVIPLEKLISHATTLPFLVFLGWSAAEEICKYLAAYFGGMHTKAEDEPVDAMIYLITAALGFAAAENTLFILQPFLTGDIFTGLVTLNIRFIGTTLLHILSSAIIGASVAFSFYKSKKIRHEYLLFGFLGAIVLHAVFNFLILFAGSRGIFIIFACIWILIIGLLLLFERVKRIQRN